MHDNDTSLSSLLYYGMYLLRAYFTVIYNITRFIMIADYNIIPYNLQFWLFFSIYYDSDQPTLSISGCALSSRAHHTEESHSQHGNLLRPWSPEHVCQRGPGVGECLLRDARLQRLSYLLMVAPDRAWSEAYDGQEADHGADLGKNHVR